VRRKEGFWKAFFFFLTPQAVFNIFVPFWGPPQRLVADQGIFFNPPQIKDILPILGKRRGPPARFVSP